MPLIKTAKRGKYFLSLRPACFSFFRFDPTGDAIAAILDKILKPAMHKLPMGLYVFRHGSPPVLASRAAGLQASLFELRPDTSLEIYPPQAGKQTAEKCLKETLRSATPARHREPENALPVFGPQTARSGEAGGSAVRCFVALV
jgi:hypothetical protein